MCSANGLFISAIFLLSISSALTRSFGENEVAADDLLVETKTGWVRGAYGGTTRGRGKPRYTFRSIPFAEPPVGPLRFEPPVPKSRWEGVLDVSAKPTECIQGTDPIRGREDCLTLKVYTTEPPRAQKNLPVLVWIYGGAFWGGAPDFEEHSPDYLLDEDVIVASFHYRVGILGFLSTGDLVAPGNNGLRDQILALKWIKDNIARFGGDPDRITVFGQSAGAASISYLLQSRQARGLFSGAIMQSGVSLCLWSLSRAGPDIAQTVAQNLGLQTSNSQVLLEGLKSVNIEELQNISMSSMTSALLSRNPRDGLIYTPVIEPQHEDAIVTDASHRLLEVGEFNEVPIIMGYTSLEALLEEIPELLRLWLLTYDVQPSRLVPVNMNIASALTRASVGIQIRRHYFGSGLVSVATLPVMQFISDDQFERPIQKAAHLYASRTPVYYYRFAHEGGLWGVTNRPASGVGHTEDLGYLFDFNYEGSSDDYLTRQRMVKLWTNFAKTRNPTPRRDPLLDNVIWEPNLGDTTDLKSLEIDHGLEMTVNPNAEDIEFWERLYNQYGRPPFDSY